MAGQSPSSLSPKQKQRDNNSQRKKSNPNEFLHRQAERPVIISDIEQQKINDSMLKMSLQKNPQNEQKQQANQYGLKNSNEKKYNQQNVIYHARQRKNHQKNHRRRNNSNSSSDSDSSSISRSSSSSSSSSNSNNRGRRGRRGQRGYKGGDRDYQRGNRGQRGNRDNDRGNGRGGHRGYQRDADKFQKKPYNFDKHIQVNSNNAKQQMQHHNDYKQFRDKGRCRCKQHKHYHHHKEDHQHCRYKKQRKYQKYQKRPFYGNNQNFGSNHYQVQPSQHLNQNKIEEQIMGVQRQQQRQYPQLTEREQVSNSFKNKSQSSSYLSEKSKQENSSHVKQRVKRKKRSEMTEEEWKNAQREKQMQKQQRKREREELERKKQEQKQERELKKQQRLQKNQQLSRIRQQNKRGGKRGGRARKSDFYQDDHKDNYKKQKKQRAPRQDYKNKDNRKDVKVQQYPVYPQQYSNNINPYQQNGYEKQSRQPQQWSNSQANMAPINFYGYHGQPFNQYPQNIDNSNRYKQQAVVEQQNKVSIEPRIQKNTNTDEIPQSLLCPINQTMMQEPIMITVCGHTFEGSMIRQWVQKKAACPLCNSAISDVKTGLQKNWALVSIIQHFKK